MLWTESTNVFFRLFLKCQLFLFFQNWIWDTHKTRWMFIDSWRRAHNSRPLLCAFNVFFIATTINPQSTLHSIDYTAGIFSYQLRINFFSSFKPITIQCSTSCTIWSFSHILLYISLHVCNTPNKKNLVVKYEEK